MTIVHVYRWLAGMFVALAIGMGVILNWPGVIATLAMAALCIGLASVYARSPPR